MTPVMFSDDCSIRHDRPTLYASAKLYTAVPTVPFDAFRAMAPSFVPEAFLKKRYEDIPVNASLSDFEYAAKLAMVDLSYRNHMIDKYDKLKTGTTSKRTVGRVFHERRGGADVDDVIDDSMLPQMD